MFDYGNIVNSSRSSGSSKPLPLKQRTSSVDTRKDFNINTWTSLLALLKPREFFVTVNNFSIWRRHLCWGMSNGCDLRNYMTQRYASSMVFMSLLLGAELGVLFNSATMTTSIRQALQHSRHFTLEFWIGFTILVSIILTILSLITTFTAWGMVSAISDENAHCILRSSIGQYIGQLPQRFIIISIYGFLGWFMLFVFLLLPVGVWSIVLVTLVLVLFLHIVTVFSAFGRLILHTGAMAPDRIFEEKYEQSLLPQSLHSNLLKRAKAELANKTSITRQYRRKSVPLDCELTEDNMSQRLKQLPTNIMMRKRTSSTAGALASMEEGRETRKRADSSVRFSDRLWTTFPTVRTDTSEDPTSEMSSNKVTPTSYGQATAAAAAASVSRKLPVSALKERKQTASPPPAPPADAAPPPPPPPRPVLPQGFTNQSLASLDDWLSAGTPSQTPLSTPQVMSDESAKSQSRPPSFPPPPVNTVPMSRFLSVTSSIGNDESFSERPLTDDEKFEREYGDLFDPEGQNTPTSSAASENFDQMEQTSATLLPEEHRRLLGGTNNNHDYSSTSPTADHQSPQLLSATSNGIHD